MEVSRMWNFMMATSRRLAIAGLLLITLFIGAHETRVHAQAVTWYFAEGSTQPPFDTWFLVQNPTDQTASVSFTFQLQDGTNITRNFSVGPTSRFSLFANEVIPNVAFSTRIDADQSVFAERAMYVNYDGHIVTGISGPNTVWMFAEGSTQDPFHTWLLLQNPDSQPAQATIRYMPIEGTPVVQVQDLAPNSRTSIFVNQFLPDTAFSVHIESTLPIVVERAMYRFPGNAATGVAGVNETSKTWYFADGFTAATLDTWLLLQNPNATTVNVTIRLMEQTGEQTTVTLTMPPTSRRSIELKQVRPIGDFGIVVEASEAIVAEKSLFFDDEPRGAAATEGAAALATVWNLPEGETRDPFNEYIAILNPNNAEMSVHIDFQLANGVVIGRDFTIAPMRKRSVFVDEIVQAANSARITTSIPSVVERTMFIHKFGVRGGHNTIGIK
jgi:hypothetical protein